MIKVGITGGIGSGKTTVCLIFEKLGIPVYYADERAKVLMNNSKSIRALLIDHFGNSIYNTSVLNREKLASIIFNDKKALEVVNSIVHPAVANDFELWSNSHSRLPYVMEEAALLFESSGYMQMDLMITVSAPEEVRIYRVVKRDMTTSEQVRKRMDSQWPEEEKICRSQFVIQNDEKHSLVSQINTIHHTILSKQ